MSDVTEKLRVNLRYEQADLKCIRRYAKSHDVERQGRYDVRLPRHLTIWTHHWGSTGSRAESRPMFSLEFNWKTGSLVSVRMQPGFDWHIFLDELARLEKASLGKTVYGQRRGETKTGKPGPDLGLR
jgi:hypothetical protein